MSTAIIGKTNDQLDGLTCWECGRMDGPMIPIGPAPVPPSWRDGERSETFAHPECVWEVSA